MKSIELDKTFTLYKAETVLDHYEANLIIAMSFSGSPKIQI
jgi:hypothetical protein